MHEAEKKDIQSADGAINQALKEEFNGSTIPTGLGIAIKRQRKTKLKSKHLELHTSGSTDGNSGGHFIHLLYDIRYTCSVCNQLLAMLFKLENDL